eukprot:1941266-Amphidinium_carterae.1
MPCFAVLWAQCGGAWGSQMPCSAVFWGPQCFGGLGSPECLFCRVLGSSGRGPHLPNFSVLGSQCFGELRPPKCPALQCFGGLSSLALVLGELSAPKCPCSAVFE